MPQTFGSGTFGSGTFGSPASLPGPPAPVTDAIYGLGRYGVDTLGLPIVPAGVVSPAPFVLRGPPSASRRMRRNLPHVYADKSTMRLLADAIAAEYDLVYDALLQIQAQAFVLSATWGIQYWEALLSLPVSPTVPLETRRSTVLAALAPAGPVTMKSIQTYMAKFRHGTVNVSYIPQLWQVSIEFADYRGLPPDIKSLQAGLDALVPAWLALNYKFRYTTYGELKRWGITYRQMKTLGLTYGQLRTWLPSGAGASQPGNTAATFAQETGGLIAQTNSTAATFAQPSITINPTG